MDTDLRKTVEPKKRKTKSYFRKLFLVAISALAIFYAARYWPTQNTPAQTEIKITNVDPNSAGQVLGESGNGPPAFQSENLRVPHISIGGEGIVYLPAGGEQTAITIEDLKSQIFTDKNKKDKKLLVSWKTSKAASCSLEFEKAGGPPKQGKEEGNFGYDHSVLIEPLENSTTYNYTVKATDKWGNQNISDKFAIYTGAAEVSFLDLIANAFKDVFGWAMKK